MNQAIISLTELEDAINYWRTQRPASGEECALSPEVSTLASVYAIMIMEHRAALELDSIDPAPRQLLDAWRQVSTQRQASSY